MTFDYHHTCQDIDRIRDRLKTILSEEINYLADEYRTINTDMREEAEKQINKLKEEFDEERVHFQTIIEDLKTKIAYLEERISDD